jgi:hypothetical protein
MKKAKVTQISTRRPKLPIRRVPRPIIALAAAPNIRQPNIGIERKLKGGELSWTMDGNVTERMVQRALATARMMIIGCLELEAEERTRRAQQTDIAAQLEASIAKVKSEKAASQ